MADAIVLITTESDMVSEAAKRIVELEGVQDVYSVAGDVDLVAVVSTDHFEDLTSVIPEGIAKVDGVVGTQTLMAFRTYSREDEQAASIWAATNSRRSANSRRGAVRKPIIATSTRACAESTPAWCPSAPRGRAQHL